MKLKKLLSLLMITTMAGSLLVGCGKDSTSTPNTPAPTTPAASESPEKESTGTASGTVRIMMGVAGGKDDAEMALFQDTLSKATGLDIQIEKPASDYSTILMQKLSGGEKYDLIYVGNSEYMNLIGQDALLDITDRVKNSPILSGNIEQSEWDDITIDGKIYAGFNKKEVHRVVALNNALLKAAGISDYKTIEPTLDGYYDVFKKLKETSTVKDFYPLDTILSETWDLQPWMAAAGLKNGVVLDTDGKKYSPYATDAAAPVWDWFKKLYDEGLMDPSAFVDKTKDMREKMGAASMKTAVTADWVAWVGMHNANAEAAGISKDEYEIVSLPGLKTPDGSYMLGKGGASLYAVPANAENVDGAMKVLEYFATQEGGELLSIGVPDYDYTVTDSKYVLTEAGKAHGSDHGAPVPIFKDFKAPLGFNTGVEEALSYGQYSSVDLTIPNESDWKATVGKWGIQIIKGEIPTLEGLESMRNELISLEITEK